MPRISLSSTRKQKLALATPFDITRESPQQLPIKRRMRPTSTFPPKEFNCGFVTFNQGTVTLTSGQDTFNRSGRTTLSAQYQAGSIMVMKRRPQRGHEFLVGGDFA